MKEHLWPCVTVIQSPGAVGIRDGRNAFNCAWLMVVACWLCRGQQSSSVVETLESLHIFCWTFQTSLAISEPCVGAVLPCLDQSRHAEYRPEPTAFNVLAVGDMAGWLHELHGRWLKCQVNIEVPKRCGGRAASEMALHRPLDASATQTPAGRSNHGADDHPSSRTCHSRLLP